MLAFMIDTFFHNIQDVANMLGSPSKEIWRQINKRSCW